MKKEFSDFCVSRLGDEFSYQEALALRTEYEDALKESSEQFKNAMLQKADLYLLALSKIKQKKSLELEIDYTPKGIWERFALHRIKQNSKVGLIAIILMALIFIFLMPVPEGEEHYKLFFWILIVLAFIQYFETKAIRRIMTKLNQKSEPGEVVNASAAAGKAENH